MAAGVSAASIIIALPLAYLLARRTIARNLLMPVITVPRMLPFVVIGCAMIRLLAPVTGVLNKVLVGLGIISEPLFFLFDWEGQALAFGYSGIVIATGILTGVLMSVDPQLEDAAVSLGASRLKSFFVVTLPLSMPGIIAAGALIFTFAPRSGAPASNSARLPMRLSYAPTRWPRPPRRPCEPLRVIVCGASDTAR